ncbi:uncharacterized protein [Ambystoma mexicanum]|uniref:uncharacterized protein isoform X2 n=1 Tax=Ambystoma mexicanum TaxID=8296 RepID=UPI0037E9BF2C
MLNAVFGRRGFYYDRLAAQEKEFNPENNVSFFSKITYSWYSRVIFQGYKKPLEREDLFELNENDSSYSVCPNFEKHWRKEVLKQTKTSKISVEEHGLLIKNYVKQPSLLNSLWQTFKFLLIQVALIKMAADVLAFMSPQILKHMIIFCENRSDVDGKGYMYATALLMVAVSQTLVLQLYQRFNMLTAAKIKTAVLGVIYQKSLNLANSSRSRFTTGELVNLMSSDAQQLMDLTVNLNLLWSAPFQILMAIAFLWQELGPSVLAGVAVLVLVIPINAFVASRVKLLKKRHLKSKDQRIKLLNEILHGIKILKLYAWEPSYQKKVIEIREEEMDVLKRSGYLTTFSMLTLTCIPFMVSLATFGVYFLLDEANVLTASKVFTTITLFNILRLPLFDLPTVISAVVQTKVSLRRLENFLCGEELDPANLQTVYSGNHTVGFVGASFRWDDIGPPVIKDLNMKISEGSLVAVVGQVGSGKSSLLSAILGEMEKLEGTVQRKGSVAYVSQQAWIQNAVLQQNILFGSILNKQYYEKVLDACALLPDLELLQNGDQTEIGERGVNLSGGQKQRVSLARAVYSDADIFLLDDPLSAVDVHVGNHLFDKVIGNTGLLKNKTRILVTHSLTVLPETDLIIVMEEGRVAMMGTYEELLNMKTDFAELIQDFNKETRCEHTPEMKATKLKNAQKIKSIPERNEEPILLKEDVPLSQAKQSQMKKEIIATGNLKSSIIMKYLQAFGWLWCCLTLAVYVGQNAVAIGQNIWLSTWATEAKEMKDPAQWPQIRNMRLGVYGLLGYLQGFIMASNGQPATNRYVRFREMLVARLTYSFECGLSMCAIVFFISMFCLVLHWIIAFISTEMNEGGGGNNTTLAPGTKTIPTVNVKDGDFLIWDGSHFVWGYYTTPPTAVLSQWRTKNVDNDTMSQPGTYNNHTIPPAPMSNNDLLFIKEDGKVIMMTEHKSLYEELEKGGGREEGGPGSSPPITRRYRRREKSRRRRETGGKGYDEYYGLGLDKMEDPRHPHQANKWYADMSTTAKQTTNESCYVCSLIPHASGTPKVLLPRELPIVDAQCLLHLTLCRIKNTFQAHDVSFRMVQKNKTCYSQASGVICLKEPFFAIQGTLFSENKWKDEEVLCKAEALKGVQPEKLRWMERTCLPIWKEHIPKLTWVTAMEKPFKLQSEIQNELCFKGEGKMAMGTNKNCNKTLTIPDMKKGTAALMDTYWVCGNKAYLHLPQSWSGSCSMATLHSTLMVIPESHIDRSNMVNGGSNQNAASPTTQAHLYVLSSGGKGEELSRNKRASNYISQASSDLLAQIPDKYRLFSSVETFFASLVSSVQARANAKWLQITRWELIQLANDTEEGFNIIKVELRALRLMTMQNRYVLDLLTAIDGGVCRKIGSACCTFVPSEDAENGSLSHVIEAVHNLGEKMKMEGGAEDSSWFDNIFSWVPSWLGVTMKFLIPIVVIILVMFCLCQVGLRCCANAVPNGAMMMVTMGNSGGTIKATQEVHVQTGTDNTPRYQLVPMCRDKYIVDKLWHTTIKEPRDVELEWYEEVWVDLEETGDCIYLTCTPDEYARRGESLRGGVQSMDAHKRNPCMGWCSVRGTRM